MNHRTFLGVIQTVDELVRIFEDHPDERTREQMTALLTGVDAIHREGLERLLSRVGDLAGDDLVDRLSDDPVVKTLLGLYDFAELDVPEEVPREERVGRTTGFVPIEEVGGLSRSGDEEREEGP